MSIYYKNLQLNRVLSVGVFMKRAALLGLLLATSTAADATINPFKKSKNHNFGNNITWYESNGEAVKSGSVKDGNDTNFYHLKIDKHRLLLRLAKNDPSGELEGTRVLDKLAIAEVNVDGRPLPVFEWCLSNQQSPGRKLKQDAVVANDTCMNAGGRGDFVINLNDSTKNILANARSVEFVIEPYGRPIRLTYTMNGLAPIMAKLNKPEPPPKPVAVVKPKPKPKVVAKPKPKPKPKPVKMCYAKAPADFKSAVPAIAYPCKDAAKKSTAETKIAARVEHEKKKMAAELEAAKQEQEARQKAVEDNKREKEWDAKQAQMWIARCQRHWKKNRSPCYCEKYLDQAPAGVTNTCGN